MDKKLVHFKIEKGREVPEELNNAREKITREKNCEFYTVPEGVFDVPLSVEEAKVCDPKKFSNLSGKIYVCNAELADKATKIYDNLKFWKEKAPNIDFLDKEEIQKNVNRYEKELKETIKRYTSSCKEIKKDDIEKEINKFYALETEDYEACTLDISVEPFLPEFLLCSRSGSEPDKYLKNLPYTERDKIYKLVGKTKHIQI